MSAARDSERFKWGCGAAEGEVVWTVSGPGDGLPSHVEQLITAWGREPSSSAGDLLGTAEYMRSPAPEPAVVVIYVVVIYAYYHAQVPEAVVDWFRGVFRTLECAPRAPSDGRGLLTRSARIGSICALQRELGERRSAKMKKSACK